MLPGGKIRVGDLGTDYCLLRQAKVDDPGFKDLCESVKVHGVLQAVRVAYDDVTKKYQLIDGLQRLTAAKLTRGEDYEINATVADMPNRTGIITQQIAANKDRVATKPGEVSKALRIIISESEGALTHKELAEIIGQSPAYVGKILRLEGLGKEINELVDAGQICLDNALTLLKLKPEYRPAYITDAVALGVKDFDKKVVARLEQIRAENAGAKTGSTEFVPTARSRSLSELRAAADNASLCADLAGFAKDTAEAVRIGILYALSLDPKSLEAAKAAYEDAAKKKAEDKANREAAAALAREQAARALADKHRTGMTPDQLAAIQKQAAELLAKQQAATQK